MSISFAFDGDDVVWTQQFNHPAVYLDTFAIRAIADSDERSTRFAQALLACNGTWLLAAVSMGEFARFADPRHAEQAERLLAQVVPYIYLFLSDPADARASRGDTDPAKRSLPPADRRNMDYFSRKWAQAQSFPETFRGVFQVVHENRDLMVETLDEVAARLVASLAHHRQMEPYRRKAKAARPDDGRTRQQIISGELLRDLVLDPNASITVNEAVDLMHAVDAVDYCDLTRHGSVGSTRCTNASPTRASPCPLRAVFPCATAALNSSWMPSNDGPSRSEGSGDARVVSQEEK